MTDYNDGKWHGWNGGECPVHPQSIVEVITYLHGKIGECKASSKGWWQNHTNPIVAFRVVKPYQEPREFWAAINKNGEAVDLSKDKGPLQGYNYHKIIKVREVLPTDPS